MSRRFGDIRQMAFVVSDIDAAMAHWTGDLGIGPFFVMRAIRFKEYRYYGAASEPPEITIALAFSGAVQIELIQQHDGRASIYLDRPAGLHHVSSWLTSAAYGARRAQLLADGLTVAQEGVIAGSGIRLSYWIGDGPPGASSENASQGFFFEMSDAADDAHRGRVARLETAARNWDGRTPVIEIATKA